MLVHIWAFPKTDTEILTFNVWVRALGCFLPRHYHFLRQIALNLAFMIDIWTDSLGVSLEGERHWVAFLLHDVLLAHMVPIHDFVFCTEELVVVYKLRVVHACGWGHYLLYFRVATKLKAGHFVQFLGSVFILNAFYPWKGLHKLLFLGILNQFLLKSVLSWVGTFIVAMSWPYVL